MTGKQIEIEYGVLLPTWPYATCVVKPKGEDRLLVLSGLIEPIDSKPIVCDEDAVRAAQEGRSEAC